MVQKQRTRYLIRRIILTNLLSIFVGIATYFWMIFFLSNVNSFWDLFRKKEVYTKEDTIAPTAPFLTPIAEATQNPSIDLTGVSEPGVNITLYIDYIESDSTVADSTGAFSFTNIQVGLFDESIYVTAKDENGNISKKSTVYVIKKDIEPPEIEVESPKDGEVYKSTGHSYQVTGKTEPESSVFVNNQLAVINPDGNFSASIRLEEGNNEVDIRAVDKAENTTELKITVIFEKIN
ncbi:hypothetical protein A2982_04255 [candidate division WWE3 bacterium RIFCSPLOWO2_01_FULL_39_13]|uniref:Uncharacterized protein n=1 Tax=candidate division WWE3 bacterium RIFCSPLOWO2_01_FULL_39_13 TaxID=1802624 RepID=A0A1F4V2B1_UNCKA|nr:MAG: hypothetical protein A2982_04255 [candidate division WWE3 bacterium RIFCSPLOWO2_01_FULL_39_13]